MDREHCANCGADLALPDSVCFKTRDYAMSSGKTGGLHGSARRDGGKLVGVLAAGPASTPVSAWCGQCRHPLPDDVAELVVG